MKIKIVIYITLSISVFCISFLGLSKLQGFSASNAQSQLCLKDGATLKVIQNDAKGLFTIVGEGFKETESMLVFLSSEGNHTTGRLLASQEGSFKIDSAPVPSRQEGGLVDVKITRDNGDRVSFLFPSGNHMGEISSKTQVVLYPMKDTAENPIKIEGSSLYSVVLQEADQGSFEQQKQLKLSQLTSGFFTQMH